MTVAGSMLLAVALVSVGWWLLWRSAQARADRFRQMWRSELDVSLEAQLRASREQRKAEQANATAKEYVQKWADAMAELRAETDDADAATAENLKLKDTLLELRIESDIYKSSMTLIAGRLGVEVDDKVRFEPIDEALKRVLARQVASVDGVDIH